MYKLNFLKKENIEKAIEKEKRKTVSFIFYSAFLVSLVLLALLVFRGFEIMEEHDSSLKSLKENKAIFNNFRKKSKLNKEHIKDFYTLMDSRRSFVGIFSDINSIMDTSTAINGVEYFENNLILKFKTKKAPEITKSNLFKEINAFKDSLIKSSYFENYINKNTDVRIEGPNKTEINTDENPSYDPDKVAIWDFTFHIEFEFGIRDKVKRNRKTTY